LGENRQRQRAEGASRAALKQAYQARLTAAVTAFREHDVAEATRQLDAAPPSLRGWVWHHLRGRLDDSLAAVRLELPRRRVERFAAFDPAGGRVVGVKDNATRV